MSTVFSFEEELGSRTSSENYPATGDKKSRTSATFNVVCVSGTPTSKQARDALYDYLTETRSNDEYGNPLASVEISDSVASGFWKIVANWESWTPGKIPEDWFDYCYVDSVDSGGETATVTKSLNTRSFAATGGALVDQGGYIDVADGVARGVATIAPFLRFSVRMRLKYREDKYDYLIGLTDYQGKTNLTEFWGRPQGTVLCENVAFSLQGVSDTGSFSNAYFDGRINFAYRPNVPVNIDGAEFVKGGWEAVWALRAEVDGTDGRKKLQTICVYSEQVYPQIEFRGMGLAQLAFPTA